MTLGQNGLARPQGTATHFWGKQTGNLGKPGCHGVDNRRRFAESHLADVLTFAVGWRGGWDGQQAFKWISYQPQASVQL